MGRVYVTYKYYMKYNMLIYSFHSRLFKKLLAQRTRAFFANMLEQRKYRGQLKFDHVKQTLDIHVQPQADASQQGDMRQLSGGERSFSTVCFILSLWEAMESPFRWAGDLLS